MEIVPNHSKKLRACLLCSLIKTIDQFHQNGCENCETILDYKGDQDRILECTSSNFEGCLALMNPRSWVGRWQRIDKFQKGIYAIQVNGSLPMDVQEQLLDKGIKYRPRDGSMID